MQQAEAEEGSDALPIPSPEEVAKGVVGTPATSQEDSSEEKEETPTEMWGSLMDDDELDEDASDDDDLADETPELPAAAESPAPKEPSPKDELEGVESEVVEDPQPEQKPQVSAEQVQEPRQKPPSAEEQRALYQQVFKDLQKSYQLTPEDVEAVQLNPETVLPRLLAGVHLTVQGQVLQQVQQMMGQVVPQIVEQQKTAKASEDKFFDTWPKLKAHQNEVNQFARVWRQMNPQASYEEAVKNVGKHVMIELGYPLQEVAEESSTGRRNAPPPPARVSSISPAPPARQLNQFEALAEELLEEDF